MRIGFTGYRDCRTTESELDRIAAMYPGAVWVHGDAKDGFDAQVRAYAEMHGIKHDPHPPEYNKYPRKVAPHVRNRQIVNTSLLLVACYDGTRTTGGTYTTAEYAKTKGKHVEYVACVPFLEVV